MIGADLGPRKMRQMSTHGMDRRFHPCQGYKAKVSQTPASGDIEVESKKEPEPQAAGAQVDEKPVGNNIWRDIQGYSLRQLRENDSDGMPEKQRVDNIAITENRKGQNIY